MNHSIKFTAVVKCEVIHLHKLLEVKGVAQDPLVMYEDNSSVNQSLQDQPSRERFAQSIIVLLTWIQELSRRGYLPT
jgi:hypothetical protein